MLLTADVFWWFFLSYPNLLSLDLIFILFLCLLIFLCIYHEYKAKFLQLSIFLVYSVVLGLLSTHLLDKNLSWSPLTFSDGDQSPLSFWDPLSLRHLSLPSLWAFSNLFSFVASPLPKFHVFLTPTVFWSLVFELFGNSSV